MPKQKQRQYDRRRRGDQRRGVILIVVLSLLALFTLLMVTFIIVSSQYRQAAVSAGRNTRFDSQPGKLLDSGTFALLRDTTDEKNPLRFWSLFSDLYGYDGFTGELGAVTDVLPIDGTSRNFFDLQLTVRGPTSADPTPKDLTEAYHQLSFMNGYYNGCVLNVVSGDARNRSFRIVGYRAPAAATFPVPTGHIFRVMPIPSRGDMTSDRPSVGDRIVVNGRPFNGTGVGYNPAAAAGGPQLSSTYALQPNRRNDTANVAAFVRGGPDESYDAVDFQNMHLAGMIPTGSTTDGIFVIPSFHRPALVNYWGAQTGGGAPWINSLDRVIMRPMPWNHPNFDGSNPILDSNLWSHAQLATLMTGQHPVSGARLNPWDVDNNGDQIPDSVWLDLGYPARRTEDGKLVKPLFAFLCIDLDGRLNVNAAGSPGHIAGIAGVTPTQLIDQARRASTANLSKGRGYGPPEINLGFSGAPSYPLFRNNGPADQYAEVLLGKYGSDKAPGLLGADRSAQIKFFEFPVNYYANPRRAAYGSPPDIFGEFAVGLDHRGQPSFDKPATTRLDLISDSPYEFDVSGFQRGRMDEPYTAAMLERILRYNDGDVRQLPDRLVRVADVFGDASRRRSITTDSIDLPIPNILAPKELRDHFETNNAPLASFPGYSHGRPLHIADLLAARLTVAGLAAADVNNELAKMLSHDLLAGTRMDMNRPFGDARDNNNNFVTDDHGPTPAYPLESGQDQLWPQYWAGVRFDHDNDSTTNSNTDAYLARHLFARHLFVLLLTLKDSGFNFDLDPTTDAGSDGQAATDTAESLAQWVANVVDFRDADTIMTPFEYDPNPFNGWQVDGNPATDERNDGADNDNDGQTDEPDERGLVWGTERPELLISETFAMHDRRTEDLAAPNGRASRDPGGNERRETDAAMMDGKANGDDFDQRLRPRGRLFIELYNPWSDSGRSPIGDAYHPGELYYDGAVLRDGVVLNKQAPGGAPVWRMLVVGGASHSPNPANSRDPDHPDANFRPTDVERGIYFTNPAALPANAVQPGHGIQRHFSSLGMLPLRGGRYAVVGSGEPDGAGNYITTIGRRTDAEDDGQTNTNTDLKINQTRRIVLTPNGNPATHQAQILNNNFGEPPATDVQPAIAVVMNQGIDTTTGTPRSLDLNISEPLNGYTTLNWDPALASGEGAYAPPFDQPLDDQPLGRAALDTRVTDVIGATSGAFDMGSDRNDRENSGTGVRTIYLQRLANPLLPYHATLNPYRTIDRAGVDLTAIEGVHDSSDPQLAAPVLNAMERFGSRQRGTNPGTRAVSAADAKQLWPSVHAQPDPLRNPVRDSHVFDYRVDHTLGFSNRTDGGRYVAGEVGSLISNDYKGSARSESGDGHPFPWLTWNNRPFVSQLEMMLVPYSRSSRLLVDFSILNGDGPSATPTPPRLPYVYAGESQFGHLMNFFHSSGTSGSSPNLHRLFDYTHVPSRFVGTETWLDPNVFQSGSGTELRHPPFNKVSNFREPGRVNLNTLFEARVFDGLLGKFNGVNTTEFTFAEFIDSRRGYAGGTGDPIAFDATIPSFMGNPFRSGEAGDLVPVGAMQRTGIETTILRSHLTSGAGLGTQSDGLFATAPKRTDPPYPPLSAAHINPFRNPYFRYQSIQRLANLTTTRSNVYAIWSTIGFFEVELLFDPTTGRTRETLGKEAGRDNGTARRHRAFYIVDRSIPVAFEPGENHNIDRAILLRRVLQ